MIKDGHFKIVEKHSSGVTFGLGENGKFWILSENNNKLLDNYKGSYLQTDEIKLHTYHNQRWNAINGMMGLNKNGFTDIRKLLFLNNLYGSKVLDEQN